MTDKPLSEQAKELFDLLVEKDLPLSSSKARMIVRQIRELEAEIARLKVWASDSHVTDLEAKLASACEQINLQIKRAEAAERERDELLVAINWADTMGRRVKLPDTEEG